MTNVINERPVSRCSVDESLGKSLKGCNKYSDDFDKGEGIFCRRNVCYFYSNKSVSSTIYKTNEDPLGSNGKCVINRCLQRGKRLSDGSSAN